MITKTKEQLETELLLKTITTLEACIKADHLGIIDSDYNKTIMKKILELVAKL